MFSELSVIERHLYSEPINIQFFSKIHPRIQRISGPLYADGHFPSAAEKAMKEVESRLRELFLELKPGASPPPNAAGLIGALLSEKEYILLQTTQRRVTAITVAGFNLYLKELLPHIEIQHPMIICIFLREKPWSRFFWQAK